MLTGTLQHYGIDIVDLIRMAIRIDQRVRMAWRDMYSQNNINNILDHRHNRGRLLNFRHVYLLSIRMDFFRHFPPESILEMLAIVPVRFNTNIGVFSSSAKKEITGYAAYLHRQFGLEPGIDIICADCSNLMFNEIFLACLVESVPWIALLTDRKMNYVSFIPEEKYNQIDFVISQYRLINPDSRIKIHTEGEKSGLISLI